MNRQQEISNWQKMKHSRFDHDWCTVRVIVNGNRSLSIFTRNCELNLHNVSAVEAHDQGGAI